MGDIVDRLEITVEEVKNYLRIDPAEEADDAEIEAQIGAAKQAADDYCQRDFSEWDTIPGPVRQWCLKTIGWWWSRRELGNQNTSVSSLGSQTWKNLSEEDHFELWPYRYIAGF